MARRTTPVPAGLDQFHRDTHDELSRWFAEPVLNKLNWILEQIRLVGHETLVEFFEITLSGIIRNVSQQEPADLRVRRRKEPLDDAPVLELFGERLRDQHDRLRRYWTIAGRQPGRLIPATVRTGDSRTAGAMEALGLGSDGVECVVTSPPYATALPYIDTDRLSLLAVLGHRSRVRSGLERNLTGSREIRRTAREAAETALRSASAAETLPAGVVQALRRIHRANRRCDVGCRRENMAALLWRYFVDMRDNLAQTRRLLAPGRRAYYVVGNGRTKAGERWVVIDTCRHLTEIVRFRSADGEVVGTDEGPGVLRAGEEIQLRVERDGVLMRDVRAVEQVQRESKRFQTGAPLVDAENGVNGFSGAPPILQARLQPQQRSALRVGDDQSETREPVIIERGLQVVQQAAGAGRLIERTQQRETGHGGRWILRNQTGTGRGRYRRETAAGGASGTRSSDAAGARPCPPRPP